MVKYPRPVVVAGVDGSPASLAAARWAAAEASRRRQSVQVLYSTHLPVSGFPPYGYSAEFLEYGDIHGRSVLDKVVHEIHSEYPDLEVGTVLTRSDPKRALVDASDGVALTVVGSAGNGRVQEVLLGSVALHVAAHGLSPVAVVPGDLEPRQGPILVGVDVHAASEAAIGYAFDEASVRGVGLVAVMAFDSWSRQGLARKPIALDATESPDEHALISEQLAGWVEKYPDVPVREHVFRGRPAESLIGYAGHAAPAQQPQLIVVGSRGRGGLTGLMLGSTSHAVIANAACAVVVVRSTVK
jgi:nucleotide-binding universal stress UspA family protein